MKTYRHLPGPDLRLRVERALGAVAFVVLACGPSTPGAVSPGSGLAAKSIVATEGLTLNMACVPTGPELCFNAQDDNCNGIIDEGCGVGTGVLQFMIAWGDSPADVDLSVVDPNAVRVSKSNRSTPAP